MISKSEIKKQSTKELHVNKLRNELYYCNHVLAEILI